MTRLVPLLRRRGSTPFAPRTAVPGIPAPQDLQTLAGERRRVPVRNDRTDAQLRRLLAEAGITGGRVLEIGGRMHSRAHVFGRGFTYRTLDLVPSDATTVIGDITNCPQILDGFYDVVLGVDVFEHIDAPWSAAAEISRILAPGGLAYTSTRASRPDHPGPADSLRYTPEALAFLFADLTVLDKGFDLAERRRDVRTKATADPLALDALGAGRENVRVFYAGIKRDG